MFRYAQHDKWRCDFSRTHCVIASEHNVRAWQSTVREARIMGILCRLIASALPRNDNWNLVMLSEAKHLLDFTFLDSASYHLYLRFYSLLFSSRGTGGLLAKRPPYPP